MKKFLIMIFCLFASFNYIYATDETSILAENYFNQAINMDKAGNYAEAIKNYDKVIFYDSNNAIAYNNRAIAKYNVAPYTETSTCILFGCTPGVDMQYCDSVIEDLNMAIKLNKNLAEAYYNRGLIKSYKVNRYGAIKDYDKAIKLNSKYAKAYAARSIAEYKISNDILSAWYYNILLMRDLSKNYIKDIDKAIELDSNNANFYIKKAYLSLFKNEANAMKYYDKAIKIDPYNAEAYILRGNLKRQISDNEGAKKDLKKGKSLYPKGNEYHDISNKIRPEVFSRIDKY